MARETGAVCPKVRAHALSVGERRSGAWNGERDDPCVRAAAQMRTSVAEGDVMSFVRPERQVLMRYGDVNSAYEAYWSSQDSKENFSAYCCILLFGGRDGYRFG